MTYYALTVPGIEGLLAREIADGSGRVSERRSGIVFFEWDGDAPTLLRLGLAEDVFALVAREEVSLEKDGLRQIEALVQRAPSWERALDALYRARPRRFFALLASTAIADAIARVSRACLPAVSRRV